MNQLVTRDELDPKIVENLVLNGDVGRLTPAQKLQYVAYRCKQVGLDPAAQPFQLLRLNGKEVLYATAGATQQLCQTRGLSVQITKREKIDDIYCVEARVTDKEGRFSENMGAVPLGSLKGEALSNALLKATTKAIRRTVLAHCGLGLLDETEVETIPGAVKVEGQRGNPIKAEADRLADEIEACGDPDMLLAFWQSPEVQDFLAKAEGAASNGAGLNYADVTLQRYEDHKSKLEKKFANRPPVIESAGNDAGSPEAPPVRNSTAEPPSQSPITSAAEALLDRMDIAETQAELEVIGTDIKNRKANFTDAEMKMLRKAFGMRLKTLIPDAA